MARYAATTTTPAERSRDEVYRVLARYGAQEHMVGGGETRILVGFKLRDRFVRIDVALPPKPTDRVERTASGQFLPSAVKAWEQEVRRKWRVLVLLLKSRLELVAEEIETVDQAFMPYLLLPDESTVQQHVVPTIRQAYQTGQMPESMLPGLPAAPRVIELPQRTG